MGGTAVVLTVLLVHAASAVAWAPAREHVSLKHIFHLLPVWKPNRFSGPANLASWEAAAARGAHLALTCTRLLSVWHQPTSKCLPRCTLPQRAGEEILAGPLPAKEMDVAGKQEFVGLKARIIGGPMRPWELFSVPLQQLCL